MDAEVVGLDSKLPINLRTETHKTPGKVVNCWFNSVQSQRCARYLESMISVCCGSSLPKRGQRLGQSEVTEQYLRLVVNPGQHCEQSPKQRDLRRPIKSSTTPGNSLDADHHQKGPG